MIRVSGGAEVDGAEVDGAVLVWGFAGPWPLTAGIGLVAPDAVILLTQKASLSEEDYNQKAVEVVGKGALATMLVCAGPIGWLGLAGISIATAYGNAREQAAANRCMGAPECTGKAERSAPACCEVQA